MRLHQLHMCRLQVKWSSKLAWVGKGQEQSLETSHISFLSILSTLSPSHTMASSTAEAGTSSPLHNSNQTIDRPPSHSSSKSNHHHHHHEELGPNVQVGLMTRHGDGAGVGAGVGGGDSSGTNNGAVGADNGGDDEQPKSKHKHKHHHQTLLTKALLSYIKIFRVAQPLASLGALGTITPVLHYFRNQQTMFPTIQATLYVFTATLACCSLFFSIIYLMDVLLRKPLFWPFTNKHFRRSSKARIGGDLMICMIFCGLWFLAMIGLIIDSVWVDCTRLTGLEAVFHENHRSINSILTVCRLEKATLGLAVISWACWMGVLLVLLYGHFWKRRQVIAARLRDRLARRRHPSPPQAEAAGVSSAISHDAGQGGSISGRNGGANNSGVNSGTVERQHAQQPSDCQRTDGEVGLDGIICRYDDERSSINHSIGRAGPSHSNVAS